MKLEDLLVHQTDLLALSAGETLFKEGEAGDTMYVLMSGTADVIVKGHVVELADAGAILGELALIDNSPRSANVVATGECNLLAIDAKRFTELVQEVPGFAMYVMQSMAARLRKMGSLL
ncbi:MAG: cyclic nucleotide-binding domain-containing protein [Betaproteobacteria bacterium]